MAVTDDGVVRDWGLSDAVFLKRTLIAIGLVILAVILLVIAFKAVAVLLLIFLAILLAIFVRTLAAFVRGYSGWRFRWCMLLVLGVILGLITLGVLLLGPNAAIQISDVMQQLPQVRDKLQQYGWAGLVYHIPGMEQLLSGQLNIWNRLTESFSFSNTFGPIISVGLVIVIGLYLAAAPGIYVDGAVSLCPPAARPECRRILESMGETLKWWLLGQSLGMLFIAITVSIGLRLLRMPLSITLGIFAGLMAFIPNIGYFLSIAPAILLAVIASPFTAFWVLVLYTGAHWGNDYVITPAVQRRTVHLPPGLTISMQLLLGFLMGGIGLMIATPLVAVLLVLVKAVYTDRFPAK